MLDPIVLALGLIAYFVGRNWGWLAALAAIVAGALALFGVMLAMGGAVAVSTLGVYAFGIGAWAALCYLVMWLSSRLRSAAK